MYCTDIHSLTQTQTAIEAYISYPREKIHDQQLILLADVKKNEKGVSIPVVTDAVMRHLLNFL